MKMNIIGEFKLLFNGMTSHYSGENDSRYFSNASNQDYPHPHNQHRKMFIERNSQEEQEIVIPYWDDESSSHYHLMEEVKLLKKKNHHFQAHMGRMKQEYEGLKDILKQADQSEREHVRRNAEITQKYSIAVAKIQQLKNEVEILKDENRQLVGDLRTKQAREVQNRKKINKLKDLEATLNSRILELEEQLKLLNMKSEEEKKILQKSRVKELQILKKNHEDENNRSVITAQILVDLKAKMQEKDRKICQLEDENSSLRENVEKLKRDLSKKENPNEQALSKSNDLKLEIQSLHKKIKSLADENEALKKESKTKLRRDCLDSMRTVDMIYTGIGQVKLNKEELELEDALIENLKMEIREYLVQIQLLKKRQADLQLALASRDQQIEKLQTSVISLQEMKKEEQKRMLQGDDKSLRELQEEYNSELQALRRLVVYKQNPQVPNNIQETALRRQYQNKFDVLVVDYQELQRQLLLLQEDLVLNSKRSEDYAIRLTEDERIMYLQAIRKWQIACEQQRAIYETKLVSKDEEINLLNLRLVNLM